MNDNLDKLREALSICGFFSPRLPDDIGLFYDFLISKKSEGNPVISDSLGDRIMEFIASAQRSRNSFVDTSSKNLSNVQKIDFSKSKEKAIEAIKSLDYSNSAILHSRYKHKYDIILSKCFVGEEPIIFRNFFPIPDFLKFPDYYSLLRESAPEIVLRDFRDSYRVSPIFRIGDMDYFHYCPQIIGDIFQAKEGRRTIERIADSFIENDSFTLFGNPFIVQLNLEFQNSASTENAPEFAAIIGAVKPGHESEVFEYATGDNNA